MRGRIEKEEGREGRWQIESGSLGFMTGNVKGGTPSQKGSEAEAHRAESEQREEEREQVH